uniref:CBFD_NFYB_HMF domain-containing protein n=1 Tax=Parastrongyloides trichosuri TaxID=131310 RepID=A0A0N4ZPG6_PARTI
MSETNASFNGSDYSNNDIPSTVSTPQQGNECKGVIPDQIRFLPIANVTRVMKRAIPSQGKLSKEARECVQECVSEFISFISSEASDKCALEKRKTITTEDILYAFKTLGFDNYHEYLSRFAKKYRAAQWGNSKVGGKNNENKDDYNNQHLIDDKSHNNINNKSNIESLLISQQLPQQIIHHNNISNQGIQIQTGQPTNNLSIQSGGIIQEQQQMVISNQNQMSLMMDSETGMHYLVHYGPDGTTYGIPVNVSVSRVPPNGIITNNQQQQQQNT